MSGDAKSSLKGRVLVNGDNGKARLIDVFDVFRDGVSVTMCLLRYPEENDLAIRPISEVFEECSVFWGEDDADSFIRGHRRRGGDSKEDREDGGKPLPTLGARIKAARLAEGVTRRRLAKRLGVARHIIRQWESNRMITRREDIAMIAEICGVRADWLMSGRGSAREGND